MPAYIGYAYEAALFVAGCVVLFRLCSTPAARARWAVPRLGPWGGSGADLMLLLLLAPFCGIALPWLAGLWIRHSTLGENAIVVALEAALEGGLLLACGIFFLAIKPRRPEPADAPAGVRSGFAAFAVSIPLILAVSLVWQLLLGWAGMDVKDQAAVEQFENLHSAWLKLAFIGVAVVLAPLAEEAIFRKGIYGYLREKLSNGWAVALSAFLFGCAHLLGPKPVDQLGSLPQLILLGAILAIAYERTGTLRVPIVAHALFNLNTLVGLLLGIAT